MTSKAATLEVAVLGLLQETPLHGYELRKRLNLLLGRTRLLSYGSLYPALKRMLRAGWITEVTTDAAARRQRIVYQVTPEGIDYFTHEITDAGPSAWEDESFSMRFAFFSRTDSDIRLRILEGRRARLQERLDRTRSVRGPEGGDRYLAELLRHSVDSAEREVRWLTDLIDAERGTLTPRADPVEPSADPDGHARSSTSRPSPRPGPQPSTAGQE